MALPSSGQISMSQVNVELSKASNALISLDDSDVRTLFAKLAGQISLSDGWGKSSGPYSSWIRRTPTPTNAQDFFLKSIAYSSTLNLFVIPGSSILTSSNAIDWTDRTAVSSSRYSGAVWGNNIFVVCRAAGGIFTSPDGITWTTRTSGITANIFNVAWNGTLFVVVGAGGTIVTSTNGTSWTVRTSGTTSALIGIAWNGSTFVAVGASGNTRTSPDGITWTARTSGTTSQLNCVSWINSLFVSAGASGQLRSSPDGITWTNRTGIFSAVSNFFAIGSSGSTFVMAGQNTSGGGAHVILRSTNGLNWSLSTTAYSISTRGVYVNSLSRFVIGGPATTSLYSSDAITWNTAVTNTNSAFSQVAWSGQVFAGVNGNGDVRISSDGITWTTPSYPTGNGFYGIAYIGNLNQFLAVGIGGRLLAGSQNGTSWSSQTGAYGDYSTRDFSSAINVGSNTIIIGSAGFILYNYTNLVSFATSFFLWDIAWNGSLFVIVGGGGIILTSPNGTTWTSRTSGVSVALYSVTWSSTTSTFIAVGAGGTILTSSDGITWSSRTSNTTEDLFGIVASSASDLVIASGNNFTILSSS